MPIGANAMPICGMRAERFSDCFHDNTLPPEVMEAVAANLSILKSPTILRQIDGRMWGWEGCDDNFGAPGGTGSCTHVWNYAQAMPHLFPAWSGPCARPNSARRRTRRPSGLPQRPADPALRAQFLCRRRRPIGRHHEGLSRMADRRRHGVAEADMAAVKRSLDYCIETWDPGHGGLVEEPHHNTYDIEFWGPDGMCSSFYLGALQAAVAMGRALGDPTAALRSFSAKGKTRSKANSSMANISIQRVERKGFFVPIR